MYTMYTSILSVLIVRLRTSSSILILICYELMVKNTSENDVGCILANLNFKYWSVMQTEPKDELIEEIQNWLKDQNIWHGVNDLKLIKRFLTGCKFKSDKAKVKMTNYYEIRKNVPELFRDRDPYIENVTTLLNLGVFFPLPRKDDEGNTLFVVKATINDPKKIPMSDVFKVGIMCIDLAMELDDSIVVNGVGVLIDLSGVSLGHALQMTPSLIHKMVRIWQDCYPIRINRIDFINSPPSVGVILNIFKRFLKESIKKRLRIHGTQLSNLHAVIDAKLLPNEYGGDLGPSSFIIDDWRGKVLTYRDWFLQDSTVI